MDLLPRVRDAYAVAAFNMGTNDALLNYDAATFERNVRTAAETLTAHAERVVVLTVAKSAEATAIIRTVAAEHGALVVDSTLTGVRLMRADGVHPSALGQLLIADRAAGALGVPLPSTLALNGGRGRLGVRYRASHALSFALHAAKGAARRVLR